MAARFKNKGKIKSISKMLDSIDAIRSRNRLIVLLSLLTFSNIACFTIITSFTKSNILNAIASSTYFINIYNQKPYFLLYGMTGISFVIYSCLYYLFGRKVSFERRIKGEMLAMLTASLVLYCIPQVWPGFHKNFLPAACYFVIVDIFDELIIVQTWSLINYCINIRESKKYQYIFLLSGSMGALISGYLIVGQVSGGNQLIFLLMTALFSAFSYGIIKYIFSGYSYRINVSISAANESLKTLLSSQKKYKIIRSIVLIVILIGIFNLLFKVLFDVQVNAYYPTPRSVTAAAPSETASHSTDPSVKNHPAPDPKTRFIGRYKAGISIVQVLLQILFVYFFARLWLSGKVLYAYPLLLIPNLLFIAGVYVFKPSGYQPLIFWGTISACAINDLLKRVIFDSSYQLLMFSIPEQLCNAIRLYSRLFFKPVCIISICAFFLIIPGLGHPIVVYTLLLTLLLAAMLPVISRIPRRYVLSLRESIQRRISLDSTFGSLINYQPNLILDQYKIARAQHNDKFNFLYLLNLIRNSYTSELDGILRDLLKHESSDVRFESVSVIRRVEATHLIDALEKMCRKEEDKHVRAACLQAIAVWGPVSSQSIYQYLNATDSIDLLKYNLAIVHRHGSDELQEKVEKEIVRLLMSENDGEVLAGIWLVGELKLTAFKEALQRHFSKHGDQVFDALLEATSKMGDIKRFVRYLEDVGFDKIRNYASLNKHLARFGSRAFDVIFDMLVFMTLSKSFIDLEKCLRTLRFLPSQDAVNFLVDVLFRFPNPHVKREALLCINRLKRANAGLDFDELIEKLPDEIGKCRDLCTDYAVIASIKPGSLLLLELARNIESQVLMIFQILDILNPELRVMDSFFRIKWYSDQKEYASHTKAKSIEYLETIIKHENAGILEILESIRFDDGLFCGADLPAGTWKDIEDIYEKIFQGQDYWLKLSAVWGMPRSISERFEKFTLEVEAMMPQLEKCQLIKDSPMLKGLSMMELMMLAEFMEVADFRAADYVFRIGEPTNALYKILEGKAELLDQDQRRIQLLEPPFGIGFGFIIRKTVRSYDLRCIEDSRMVKITSDDFNEILELNPRIYKNIFEILLSMVDKDIYRL